MKKSIEKLDKSIADAKAQYSSALSSLERISNEIHQSRDRNVSQKAAREAIEGASATPSTGPPGERTDGVGAEVNVDAVLAEMTNLTFQYTESLGSLDDVDDDRPVSVNIIGAALLVLCLNLILLGDSQQAGTPSDREP